MSVGLRVPPAAQTSGSFSPLRQRKAACPASAAGGAAGLAAQHCGLVPPGGHPTSTLHTNKKRTLATLTPLSPASCPLFLDRRLSPPTPGPPVCPVSPSSFNSPSPRPVVSSPLPLVPCIASPVLEDPAVFSFLHLHLGLPVRLPLSLCPFASTFSDHPVFISSSSPLRFSAHAFPSPLSFFFIPRSPSSICLSRSLRLPFPASFLRGPLIFLVYLFSRPRAFPHLFPAPALLRRPARWVPSLSFLPDSFLGWQPFLKDECAPGRQRRRRAERIPTRPRRPRATAVRRPLGHKRGLERPRRDSGERRSRGAAEGRLPSSLGLALDLSSAAWFGAWTSSSTCWFHTLSALPQPPSTLVGVPRIPSGDSGRPTQRRGLGTGWGC